MRFTIRQTLALGIGAILALFAISGILSYYQARIVVGQLESITEVSLARSASAYEMEINLAEIGLAVKGYLHTPSAELLDRMADDSKDFERALTQFRQSSRNSRDRDEESKIGEKFAVYHQSATELIRLHDVQTQNLLAYRAAAQRVDHAMHGDYEASVAPGDRKGINRVLTAMRLSNDLHGMGEMVGVFLATGAPEYETAIAHYMQALIQRSEDYVKAADAGEESGKVRAHYQELIDLTRRVRPIIALEKKLGDRFKDFLVVRSQIDDLFDDDVQPATTKALDQANVTAISAAHKASVVVWLAIVLGLAVGLMFGIATTNGVMRHIRALTMRAEAIAQGDFSSRATVQPGHEFAILAESFNLMAARRAEAEASLRQVQARLHTEVESRTSDLHRANRLLQEELETRRVNEASLKLSAAVFDSAREAIVITDSESVIVMANKAFERITGYASSEVIGKSVKLLSDRHQDEMSGTMTFALQETGYWQGQQLLRSKGGELFPAWESITLVLDSSDQLINQVWVFADITPLKQSEAQLRHLAHHDTLTGLPNRLLFTEHLQNAITRADKHQQFLGLFFVDLDRFKSVNDTFGHTAGDALLRAVANRLRQCVRETDIVARLGGDEFTIILEPVRHSEDLARAAEKILGAFTTPFLVADHEMIISLSIGISVYPADAQNPEALLKHADSAVHTAKDHGKNCYRYYRLGSTDVALTAKL